VRDRREQSEGGGRRKKGPLLELEARQRECREVLAGTTEALNELELEMSTVCELFLANKERSQTVVEVRQRRQRLLSSVSLRGIEGRGRGEGRGETHEVGATSKTLQLRRDLLCEVQVSASVVASVSGEDRVRKRAEPDDVARGAGSEDERAQTVTPVLSKWILL
jgi:hypothetical protein